MRRSGAWASADSAAARLAAKYASLSAAVANGRACSAVATLAFAMLTRLAMRLTSVITAW